MNTYPIWLHFKDRRGGANRSVTKESRRNHAPYLCVTWSPVLYGFLAGAKAILFAIIKWKPWMKLHFLFKTHRSKEIQKDSLLILLQVFRIGSLITNSSPSGVVYSTTVSSFLICVCSVIPGRADKEPLSALIPGQLDSFRNYNSLSIIFPKILNAI